MLQLLLAVCLSLLLQPSAPASPEPPAPASPSSLARFSPEAQSQITAAAAKFRVDADTDTWYDASALIRLLELRERPSSDAREVAAHGADGSVVYKTVPLLYDGRRGRMICDVEEVAKLVQPTADGYSRCDMVLVCERIVSPDLAIARVFVSTAFRNDLSWSPKPDPNPYPTGDHVLQSLSVAVRNHTFRIDGDAMSIKLYREVEPTKDYSRTLRTLEPCPPEKVRPALRVPTPEELADAILTGRARLTEWTWERKQVSSLERGARGPDGKFTRPAFKWVWTPKDITPIPGED